jgi:hypothetical protein
VFASDYSFRLLVVELSSNVPIQLDGLSDLVRRIFLEVIAGESTFDVIAENCC